LWWPVFAEFGRIGLIVLHIGPIVLAVVVAIVVVVIVVVVVVVVVVGNRVVVLELNQNTTMIRGFLGLQQQQIKYNTLSNKSIINRLQKFIMHHQTSLEREASNE